MIKVCNLTKKYGKNIAINNLNFSINQDEIVGFLGVNGAGKTTTMRILAGCLSQTSGNADVLSKKIGYLAENAPLYLHMRVSEFLLFRSCLKGYSCAKAKNYIKEIMDKVLISDVSSKIIGNLSKGYRQRVALADALLNEPEVLILDEPTSGLDPKQIIEVRKIIRMLKGKCTVLLSSHILSEVEAVCDRVLIFNNGELVLDQKVDSSLEDVFVKVTC